MQEKNLLRRASLQQLSLLFLVELELDVAAVDVVGVLAGLIPRQELVG
jgi:hypothetical protein